MEFHAFHREGGAPEGAIYVNGSGGLQRASQAPTFRSPRAGPGSPRDAAHPAALAAFAERVESHPAAPGVWHIAGGSHNSVLVEFADHLMLIESPLYDGRAQAVLAEMRKLVPAKPLRYVVNSHHHFDHSGGLRTYMAQGTTLVTAEANREFYQNVMFMLAVQGETTWRFYSIATRLFEGVAIVNFTGFEDLIEIGRQNRPSLYDPDVDRPPPLVPRERRRSSRSPVRARTANRRTTAPTGRRSSSRFPRRGTCSCVSSSCRTAASPARPWRRSGGPTSCWTWDPPPIMPAPISAILLRAMGPPPFLSKSEEAAGRSRERGVRLDASGQRGNRVKSGGWHLTPSREAVRGRPSGSAAPSVQSASP